MEEKLDAGLNRRSMLKAAGAGGAALLAAPAAAQTLAGEKKRHVIVGTGHRARAYQDAIWGKYKDRNSLVGICDNNPGRLAFTARRAAAASAPAPKVYLAAEFDKMIRDTRPHTVIVSTTDGTHDDYIVRALDAGCDVITEKPMTTTAAKAQRILDAVKRNKRHVRVAFNYRFTPPRTQVKELLMAGTIGDILSVDFNWLLDTTHGADYFRRWHSRKAVSGGLMVHKSTHHFDLVNWWLGALPVTVDAVGKKEFYTPAMARRLGLAGPHERCRTCPEKDKCSFFLDITASQSLKALYADNEHYDGYYRDQCVWRPEIDIEDTMNVIVGYDNGATLSYSLNACNAWEGYQIAFNGTQGRLEHSIVETTYVAGGDMVQGGTQADRTKIRVYPLRGPAKDITPRTGTGGHGGGDDIMMADLFGEPTADTAGRVADERAGAYSILIGAAANQCFKTGKQVRIADMVKGLTRPDMPPMPTRRDPVPMPPRALRA